MHNARTGVPTLTRALECRTIIVSLNIINIERIIIIILQRYNVNGFSGCDCRWFRYCGERLLRAQRSAEEDSTHRSIRVSE